MRVPELQVSGALDPDRHSATLFPFSPFRSMINAFLFLFSKKNPRRYVQIKCHAAGSVEPMYTLAELD